MKHFLLAALIAGMLGFIPTSTAEAGGRNRGYSRSSYGHYGHRHGYGHRHYGGSRSYFDFSFGYSRSYGHRHYGYYPPVYYRPHVYRSYSSYCPPPVYYEPAYYYPRYSYYSSGCYDYYPRYSSSFSFGFGYRRYR